MVASGDSDCNLESCSNVAFKAFSRQTATTPKWLRRALPRLLDECVPAIIEECCYVLVARFSQDELRELISIFENETYVKYCGAKEALDDEFIELFMQNMYNGDEVYKRLLKNKKKKYSETESIDPPPQPTSPQP